MRYSETRPAGAQRRRTQAPSRPAQEHAVTAALQRARHTLELDRGISITIEADISVSEPDRSPDGNTRASPLVFIPRTVSLLADFAFGR